MLRLWTNGSIEITFASKGYGAEMPKRTGHYMVATKYNDGIRKPPNAINETMLIVKRRGRPMYGRAAGHGIGTIKPDMVLAP